MSALEADVPLFNGNPPHDKIAFSAQRLARLAQLEKWHFWFVGRQILINRLVQRYAGQNSIHILDLGCGTGYMMTVLKHKGYYVVGLDIRPEGLRAAHLLHPKALVLQSTATGLPFASCSFDAVMMLDVLEHVDDRACLAEACRILKSGGLIIVSVPAFQWLWSYRDQAAGHLRRYTGYQLGTVLKEARFAVLEMRYYQFFLFPLVVMSRWLGRNGPAMRDNEERPPTFINSLLTWLNKMEVTLGDKINWPWGSTLTTVARKKDFRCLS